MIVDGLPTTAEQPASPHPGSLAAAGARSTRSRQLRHQPWWFAAPAVMVFAIFFFLPNMLNFVYPFTNWSAFHAAISFNGLDNFRSVLGDGSLLSSLRITLIYAALVAIFQNVFGLALAVLLERDTRLNRLIRALFFIPVLLSPLAVGYVFQALLAPNGAVNSALSTALGHHVATAWLGSPTWTIAIVALIHAWKWMGLAMLVYLAGLKAIPRDVQEAGLIDGASPVAAFWRISFPLLAPAVTFNVTVALIGSMNSFDVIQATTQGGPARTTEVLNVYIFHQFGEGLFAQAATMSLVLFLVTAALAIPIIVMLRRREQAL